MPSVTPTQIKSVGRREFKPHHYRHPIVYPVRMNGLGDAQQGVIGTTAAGACLAGAIAAPGTFGVSAALTCLPSAIKAFIGWLTCGPTSACALKVNATQFAEGIVRLCYGLEGGCSLPPPGIPVVPGANPPKFCASSVAGLIERCDLNSAQTVLIRVQSLMQQKLGVTQDPVTPYVKNWYNQYGIQTFADLNARLAEGRSKCTTLVNTGGGGSTTFPPSTGTSSSITPLLIGGLALLAFMMMKR